MSLTPLTTPRHKQKVGAYDLEWDSKTGVVTYAGFYVYGRYRAYLKVSEMLDAMLVPEHRNTYFYAHSGGRHDMTHVITALASRKDISVDCHTVGSRLILCIVTSKTDLKLKWYLADSFAVLKASLAEIGDTVGLPKIEGDTDKMSPRELYSRNKRDCEIVVAALERLQDYLWKKGGELHHTIGACAMTLFRRSYLKKELQTSKIDNEWCRGAYHAARVEVFLPEDYNGVVRDFNSAYPWAMTQGLPGRLARVDTNTTIKALVDSFYGGDFWCADVKVTVPEGHIPPLPYRNGGRIYFPVGSFRTKISRLMAELLYEYGGTIDEIIEVHHYESGFDELGHFAKEMYEHRLAAKKAGLKFDAMTDKYLGNTPYGKLAEGEEKEGLLINPIEAPPIERRVRAGVYRNPQIVEVKHAHVIGAVWITDLIKAALTRALWRLGIYAAYCDTDCTHGKDLGDKDEEHLGGMKIEMRYAKGERAAAKLYRLTGHEPEEYKFAAKGFSLPNMNVKDPVLRAKRILEANTIFDNLMSGLAREYDWFATPREAIFGNLGVNERGETQYVEKRSKRLSRQCPVCYRHLDGMGGCPTHNVWDHTVSVSGKRARDGNGTRPWTVDELKERKGL